MTDNHEPGPDACVTLREITGETVTTICKLSDTMPEAQNKMVAPNAISIAQAHFAEHAWFRAIYADETPVGFVMLWDDPTDATYYLWRFMIAAPHQRKGYGYRAIEQLIEYVKTRPNATELKASYVPMDGGPEGFYHKLGFEETGEVEHGENVIRLALT